MSVDGPFLLAFHLDGVTQLIAGTAGEFDAVGADLDLGRRRQAQRLEELLHGAKTGGGRSLHRISPAIRLVPLGDGTVLEQDGRLLGLSLGLLGGLARTLGAGQRARRKRFDRNRRADGDDERAAVRLDLQMRLQRLVVGAEFVGADVQRNVQLVLEVKMFLIAGGIAQRQPSGIDTANHAGNQPHPLIFQMQVKGAPAHRFRGRRD